MLALPLLVFSFAVARNLVEFGQTTIPFKRRFSKLSTGSNGILPADKLASTLVGEILLGTPPQPLTILFDTGSFLFWVRSTLCTSSFCSAKDAYSAATSSTAVAGTIPEPISTRYGDGTRVTCVVAQDTMSLAGIPFANQAFCEATDIITTTAETDGLIGLGPPGTPFLAADLRAGLNASGITTVAFWYNTKDQDALSEGSGGEITFGPPQKSRYNGSFQYAPLLDDRNHWNIQVDNIMLADGTQILTSTFAAIVDTGGTITVLEALTFQKLNELQLGATLNARGLYVIDCEKAMSNKPLIFQLGQGVSLSLKADQQIIRAQGSCISIFQPGASNDPNIIGAAFLASYYTVFDYGNARIGFAQTAIQSSTTGTTTPTPKKNHALVKSSSLIGYTFAAVALSI